VIRRGSSIARHLVRFSHAMFVAEGEEMRTYHDEEWGVPLHDDARLFELLTSKERRRG